MRALLIVCLASGCGATLVANQPKTILLGQRYDPGDVRDAVARAINHRRMTPQAEAPGRAVALDTRHGASCLFTVEYTNANLTISTSTDGAAPPAQIDQRCVVEADGLAKAIGREVERPGKVAAKEERARRRHELAVESARAAGEQAALQREQLEQQQQQQQAADPNAPGDAPQYADPNAGYAPAPAPTVNYQYNNSVSNSTSTSNTNVTVNKTVINEPQQPQPVQLSPFLCCRTGQPYVCPNTAIYAAACVQKPAELPRLCKIDPAQAPYCRH